MLKFRILNSSNRANEGNLIALTVNNNNIIVNFRRVKRFALGCNFNRDASQSSGLGSKIVRDYI